MLKTQIITTLDNEFLLEWGRLWEKSPDANIVNSPGWFNAALHAFKYKQIKIIAIRDTSAGELKAVAPFVKTKIFSISLFTAPALEFADKNQILADFQNKKIIEALFSEIGKIKNVYLANFTKTMLDATGRFFGPSSEFIGDVVAFINFSNGPYGNLSNRKKIL